MRGCGQGKRAGSWPWRMWWGEGRIVGRSVLHGGEFAAAPVPLLRLRFAGVTHTPSPPPHNTGHHSLLLHRRGWATDR